MWDLESSGDGEEVEEVDGDLPDVVVLVYSVFLKGVSQGSPRLRR